MDDNAEEADSHTVTAVDRASQSGPRPSSPAFTLRATPGRSDAQGTAQGFQLTHPTPDSNPLWPHSSSFVLPQVRSSQGFQHRGDYKNQGSLSMWESSSHLCDTEKW